MVVPQNGSKVAVAELLGGAATDSKNKKLSSNRRKIQAYQHSQPKAKMAILMVLV